MEFIENKGGWYAAIARIPGIAKCRDAYMAYYKNIGELIINIGDSSEDTTVIDKKQAAEVLVYLKEFASTDKLSGNPGKIIETSGWPVLLTYYNRINNDGTSYLKMSTKCSGCHSDGIYMTRDDARKLIKPLELFVATGMVEVKPSNPASAVGAKK